MAKVSNWWYLVPIVFAVLGGIVAYFALKDRDKDKAHNMIIIGVIVTAIQIVFNVGFYVMVSTMFN